MGKAGQVMEGWRGITGGEGRQVKGNAKGCWKVTCQEGMGNGNREWLWSWLRGSVRGECLGSWENGSLSGEGRTTNAFWRVCGAGYVVPPGESA
ncbi:MAG TPA: hypothetical protein IAC04_02690 [Candidatus Coprenecus stercoravium]|uniref:Uncharacterized protein n=1 Tax=Candidatus Coprenecus stercoravium TaxID=2840735 RepID=A0A9D2GQG5_9BACT|nr:hypothetical protein [Candidatus Coprenecus stercoravium]